MNFVGNKENKSIGIEISSKRSAFSEHLVYNLDCASNYNLKRFETIKNYYSIFDFIKLIFKLCKH